MALSWVGCQQELEFSSLQDSNLIADSDPIYARLRRGQTFRPYPRLPCICVLVKVAPSLPIPAGQALEGATYGYQATDPRHRRRAGCAAKHPHHLRIDTQPELSPADKQFAKQFYLKNLPPQIQKAVRRHFPAEFAGNEPDESLTMEQPLRRPNPPLAGLSREKSRLTPGRSVLR